MHAARPPGQVPPRGQRQLAQARQAYEDVFSAYGVGRAEFMSVLDAPRQWLRFRLDA